MAKRSSRRKEEVYRRPETEVLQLRWYDENDRLKRKSAGTTNWALAQKRLDAIRAKVATRKRSNSARGTKPFTARTFADEVWLPERRKAGIHTVNEDEDRLRHVPSSIMDIPIGDVTRPQLEDFFRDLMGAKRLAPRTQLHIYGALRVLFKSALKKGLIAFTPCTLSARDKELPKKRDKDPLWRANRTYNVDEIERLLSDERLPEWNRILWGGLFLGGVRINEMAPRRWRDYDAAREPLGSLHVHSAQIFKTGEEGPTKTGFPRMVPVHPELAKLLLAWKVGGWARQFGRQPTDDDFIVPALADASKMYHASTTLRRLHDDAFLLGLRLKAGVSRKRGQHDARSSMISIARANKAEKDILRWVTHGPENANQLDDYTVFPWETLCQQIWAKDPDTGKVQGLPIRLRQAAAVIPLKLTQR